VSLLTSARAGALVAAAALAVYANSLGNGFAFDDEWVIEGNPVVTEGRLAEVLETPYWPQAPEGTGNYRPLTIASFALEWAAWDGDPFGYHAVSVAAHVGVSLLVFTLLLHLVGTAGALAGGLVFAVHPVHVEAVANVVGRAELYAAAAVLGAVLLHLRGAGWTGWRRGGRLAGIALLYAAGLASKEMAVTLPGLLLLLDVTVRRDGEGDLVRRLRASLPVYLVLGATLAGYLVVRLSVLGVWTGEAAQAGLRSLGTGGRLLAALAVWPHYLRLLVAPAELSMDYQPGVLVPSTGVDAAVVAGALILLAVVAGAVALARGRPVLALALGWFFVAVLPVSNLVVRADVMLAERTLYLPSVGLAIGVAGLVPILRAAGEPRALRLGGAVGLAVLLALAGRTVTRNPTWTDTPTAIRTLAMEHPESYRALRVWGRLKEQQGDLAAATRAWEEAAALVPDDYTVNVEAGVFFGRTGRPDRAEAFFRRAVALDPRYPAVYRRWGEHLLRAGQGREAWSVALEGLSRAGADRELFAVLSESYLLRGDVEAAVRARRAAAAQPGATRNDGLRLAELLDSLDRPREAAEARHRARALPEAAAPERLP
jgi:hypothetical protein